MQVVTFEIFTYMNIKLEVCTGVLCNVLVILRTACDL